MKNKLLAFAVCIFTLPYYIFSQTSISGGNVSGTWTLAGSPYQIQGSIQIPSDSTLTIQQGVTVDFQGTYKLLVIGRLLAIGTVADTVIFTATNTTNGWSGIRFDNTSSNDTSKIIFCKLQYGKATGTSPNNFGGALYFNNFSKAIISMCRIVNCMAIGSGGGINCQNSNPTITNNTISNNTAGGGGGGINCQSGSPNITNNTISNNTSVLGSGICCQSSSPTIINNIISNNTSTSPTFGGGGIYCTNNSNPTIINNAISNNTASSGGGIYCGFNSPPTIINNTIANNSAINGGALYCADNSDPTLRNVILWGNTASTSGAQVFLFDEPSDPRFYYCNVQGSTGAFGLNGNIYTGTYSNNINADPLFVSPSAGSGSGFNSITADWSLQNTSPCIDSGDSTYSPYPATDKAGNPRVTVCRIDMGAYEYQNGVPFGITVSQTAQILCNGNATGTLQATASGGTLPYTYLWNNSATTSAISNLTAGNYTVTVNETGGCVKKSAIAIAQPSLLSINKSSAQASCYNNDGNASVTVNGGTVPYTFLWSNGSSIQNLSGIGAGTYSITVTDNNGCTISDNLQINNSVAMAPIPICLVTVDSLSQYNNIAWDKQPNQPIDSFIIYREITLNNYRRIGAVPYDSLSLFIDTARTKYFPNTGNPNGGTYRYKIQVRDTCGNYSVLSPYHNTIYMSNASGTFSWPQLYTIESSSNPVSSYVLMRDDFNTGKWNAINSVAGSQQSVTDPAYAAWAGTANWRITTIWNISCTPAIIHPKGNSVMATTIKTSKSNTYKVINPVSVNESSLENNISIFPNPTSGKFEIRSEKGVKSFKIYNLYGEEIYYEKILNPNSLILNLDVPNGIYFLKIISNQGTVNKKIIIDR